VLGLTALDSFGESCGVAFESLADNPAVLYKVALEAHNIWRSISPYEIECMGFFHIPIWKKPASLVLSTVVLVLAALKM